MKLLAWQKNALAVLKKVKLGSGLCLDCNTGIGKGVLGAWIADKVQNILIICPPHLISDWQGKINSEVNVLDKNNKVVVKGINIISYNKFTLYDLDYQTNNFFLILDEAHKVKNYKGKTFKKLLPILDNTVGQLLLSATFQSLSNIDLFAPSFITSKAMRKMYRSFYDFSRANVEFDKIYIHKRVIEKPVNIKKRAMEVYIKPQFYVATYESAGLKRPKSRVLDVTVPTNRALESKIEGIKKEDFEIIAEKSVSELSPVEYQGLINVLANPHSKFAQLSNNIMYDLDKETYKYFNYPAKIDIVKSIMETEEGNKGLLFYFYKAELEKLKKAFPNAYFYNSSKNTDKQIVEFEKGKYKLFIANYAALGEGVRFKKSHYIIEFTLIYDYARVLQARGRLQYAGRKDTYRIYHLQLASEVVINLVDNIQRKQEGIKETLELLGGK